MLEIPDTYPWRCYAGTFDTPWFSRNWISFGVDSPMDNTGRQHDRTPNRPRIQRKMIFGYCPHSQLANVVGQASGHWADLTIGDRDNGRLAYEGSPPAWTWFVYDYIIGGGGSATGGGRLASYWVWFETGTSGPGSHDPVDGLCYFEINRWAPNHTINLAVWQVSGHDNAVDPASPNNWMSPYDVGSFGATWGGDLALSIASFSQNKDVLYQIPFPSGATPESPAGDATDASIMYGTGIADFVAFP